MLRTSFALTAVAVVLVACSGGDGATGSTNGASSAGTGDPTCESTGKRFCERACACGAAGGECKTGFKGPTGASTILTWSDQADCEAAFAGSRCTKSGGPQGVDFATCAADIEAATCEADALVEPRTCETPRDAG